MDFAGKYFVVTGAGNGIGMEAAKILCRGKGHVTIACRNYEKLAIALNLIRREYPESDVTGLVLDLTDLTSVEKFATAYAAKSIPLHALILNAAVFMPPYSKTRDDYEETFQVNHLAQSYLTFLLLDVLRSSAPSRVVVVASESWKMSNIYSAADINLDLLSPVESQYSPFYAYNNSKFCNILFASEFNKRYCDSGITAHSLHPGNLVRTKLTRHCWYIRLLSYLYWPLSPTVSQAAINEIFVATSEDAVQTGKSGSYWTQGFLGRYSSFPGSPEMASALWELTIACLKSAKRTIPDM